MAQNATIADAPDPLTALGLAPGVGEEDIRERYLELVRKFPPEKHPARFREIHDAWQQAKNPMILARQLLESPDETPVEWAEVLAEQEANPPTLSVELLLSLGNRPANFGTTDDEADDESS